MPIDPTAKNRPVPRHVLNASEAQSEDNPLRAESFQDEHGNIDFVFPGIDGEEPDETAEEIAPIDFYENLVFYLSEEEQDALVFEVLEGYQDDEASRADHLKTLADSINNLGLDDSKASTPFEGACTVYHPLLIENAVKLQAKISGELLPSNGPVKTQILGEATEEDEDRARRIKDFMNYQLTCQMAEYYPNSEKAFFHAALFGDAFKKKFYDLGLNRARDTLVTLDRLVVNQQSESLELADRISELVYISPRQFEDYQVTGLYRDDVDLEPSQIQKTDLQHKVDQLLGVNTENVEGFTVIEQHLYYNLPGFEEEMALPYIVQVDKDSQTLLAVRRNWSPDTDEHNRTRRDWYSHYGLVPSFGFHHLGLIHLLGNFQKTLTAILRSLVDSGQFATLQGGFKSKTMRILGGSEPLMPGEFRDVENYGGDLTKAIVPLPFKEPSATLFQLLQFIEARGQKFADSTEQVIADSANYGPVGTTMALLDASTKFFSSIHKRFHASQKAEFKILAELNYDNLPNDPQGISFNVPGKQIRVAKQDFRSLVEIIPVSDPNISSNAHRMTMASTKLQMALQKPEIHDLREVYKEFYKAMGVVNLDKILPPPDQAVPQDPIADIASASQGKPIKAFPDQDHDSHITIKQNFLNDPQMGGNPVMQMAGPAIAANIREHLILKYQAQLQGAQQAGQQQTNQPISVEQAAGQIREFNTFKANNPGAELSPEQLLAQAEMLNQQNKSKALELQEKNDKMDAVIDMAKIETAVRGQNIDVLKSHLQLKSDEELTKLQEALNLLKEAMKAEAKNTGKKS